MKKQKTMYIVTTVIMLIIIIIGAIICKVKGFNIELIYTERQEIVLTANTELDVSKIEEIVKDILGDKKIKILTVGEFGNSVEIISTEITDEEKSEIITKINEEYSQEIENDDIQVIKIPNTRIRDILRPYIIPGIITFGVVLLYFLILYHKIGFVKVLLKGALTPIVAELLYYSVIAITRIPFGRITNAIAIGIYIVAIGALTIYFEIENKKQPEITNKKEID